MHHQHKNMQEAELPRTHRTCGHDLDAYCAPVVLYADGAPQRLMLQAQHAAGTRQKVARIVKRVEACAHGARKV
jgi:hypothetical protein